MYLKSFSVIIHQWVPTGRNRLKIDRKEIKFVSFLFFL